MANLFDKYVGSEYIPAPFENYMQAGAAQQGEYNKLRDAVQAQEDQFAMLKTRLADEPAKQAFLNDIRNKSLEMFEKNKTYNPNMYGEVRSYLRRAAQDPRLTAWGRALQNEADYKDIEKRLKAAGQEPLISSRDAIEKPVFDNQGNMIYNPESSDLGIEGKLDWVGEGSKLVNDTLKPMLKSYGLSTRNITRKGGDGKEYTQTVIVDGQANVLSKNEPRVKKVLKDLQKIWENESTAGRQWKRFNPNGDSYEFLSSLLTERNDVQESFKPLGGSQYEKWLNSFGDGEDNKHNFASSPFLSSAFDSQNLGQEPTIGQDVNSPYRQTNITSYNQLSAKEKGELYKFTRQKFNEWSEKQSKRFPMAKLDYDEFVGNYGKFDEATPDNPYGETLLREFLNQNKDVAQQMKSSIKLTVPEASFKKFAESNPSVVTNTNAVLITGKEKSMLPIGDALEGSDVSQYNIEYSGRNGIIPTLQGGTKNVAIYKVYLPADKYEEATGLSTSDAEANRTDKRKFVDSDGKTKSAYAVEVGVPMRNMTSWQQAREADLATYGPDKNIAPEQDYVMSHNYLYNRDLLQEYGYDMVRNKNGIFEIYKNNKLVGTASAALVAQQGFATVALKDLGEQNAR